MSNIQFVRHNDVTDNDLDVLGPAIDAVLPLMEEGQSYRVYDDGEQFYTLQVTLGSVEITIETALHGDTQEWYITGRKDDGYVSGNFPTDVPPSKRDVFRIVTSVLIGDKILKKERANA